MADREIIIPKMVLDSYSKISICGVLGCAGCSAVDNANVRLVSKIGVEPKKVECEYGPDEESPCDALKSVVVRKLI